MWKSKYQAQKPKLKPKTKCNTFCKIYITYMLWKYPSWPPCSVLSSITSFQLFYTLHMFSYPKCTSGFYAICGILVAHAVQGDFNTIVSFPMFINPQATSRMFSLCYAQHPCYILCIIFMSPSVLQHYAKFDLLTMVMLEKLLGTWSFSTTMVIWLIVR